MDATTDIDRTTTNYLISCENCKNSKLEKMSQEEIRIYMLGKHNESEFSKHNGNAWSGLAIPHLLQEQDNESFILTNPLYIIYSRATKIYNSTYKQYLKNIGIILPEKLEDIVIIHNTLPVDTMSPEEFINLYQQLEEQNQLPNKQYENLNFWQPFSQTR